MSIAVELIHVRSVPRAKRQALIFGAFDALASGESFEIVNDDDPMPLHEQFERTRPGEFHWHAIESGPRRWRVRIERSASH